MRWFFGHLIAGYGKGVLTWLVKGFDGFVFYERVSAVLKVYVFVFGDLC